MLNTTRSHILTVYIYSTDCVDGRVYTRYARGKKRVSSLEKRVSSFKKRVSS